MHYLLFIGAFLWFAMLAPPLVTACTCAAIFLLGAATARAVKLVTGAEVGAGEMLRAIGLLFVCMAGVLQGMLMSFHAVSGVGLLIALALCSVAVFRTMLGIGLAACLMVTPLVLVISAGAFVAIRNLM